MKRRRLLTLATVAVLALVALRCDSNKPVTDPPTATGNQVTALGPIATEGHDGYLIVDASGAAYSDGCESPCQSLVVASLKGAVGVSGVVDGSNHALCGLFADHTLRCVSPSAPDAAPTTIAADAAQASGRCWVTTAGAASCLGAGGTPAPLALGGATAKQVAADDSNVCVLLTDGTVRCWTAAPPGQPDLAGPGVAIAGVTGATQIAVSIDDHFLSTTQFHGCALAGGAVRCWGGNASGQLGDGSGKDSPTAAVAVASLAGATAVSVGSDVSCALLGDGTVRCWGLSAGYGATGQMQAATPTAIAGVDKLTSLACSGHDFCCGARADGTALCFGSWHIDTTHCGCNSSGCGYIPN